MTFARVIGVAVGVLLLVLLAARAIHVVQQFERGVVFRPGRVRTVREPGLVAIISVIDKMTKVPLRIVTLPIRSQGIITRDNVSVDISAVAYFRVIDAVRSIVAIENVHAAIGPIALTVRRPA